MSNSSINDQIISLAYSLKESVANFRSGAAPSVKGESIIQELITESCQHNPWFIADHVIFALELLAEDLLFINGDEQAISSERKEKIAVLYRPSAPLEGLSELFSLIKLGYACEVMPSPDQQYDIKKFLLYLDNFPALSENIIINNHKLTDFNALISFSDLGTTTKDYFQKYQSLQLYRNGASYILHGNEDDSFNLKIAEMICMYYGRSAQNIKVLFVPQDYNIASLTSALGLYSDQLFHNRYYNNHEYRKSAMIINHIPFKEIGPLLVTESSSQAGYTGVLCVQRYLSTDDILKNELSNKYQPLNSFNGVHGFSADKMSLSGFPHNNKELHDFLQSISIKARQ